MIQPVHAANENNKLGVTFSVTLETPIIQKSDVNQTVVMHLDASKAITMNGMGLQITNDPALKLTSITGAHDSVNITGADYNQENGKVAWSDPGIENISGVTRLLTATFTVPANTPAGTYQVGFKDLELTQNYTVDIWENAANGTATLTVEDNVSSTGYQAKVSSLIGQTHVGETVTFDIGLTHATEQKYSAGEIILNYDQNKLRFNQTSSNLGNATVKDQAGVLKIEDYGVEKQLGNKIYSLAFDAILNGNATVTIQSAAFINKTNAAKSDLISATLNPGSSTVVVNKKVYTVTLPEIFTGFTEVTEGENYTFTATDYEHFNYTGIQATMGENPVNVVDHQDGTYTIENVTGNLVITGSRTPKTYQVTFAGNASMDITDAADTATYATDYKFTIPSAEGWGYAVDEITINGVPYKGYNIEQSVCTIPGNAVTGDIVVKVSKHKTIASVTVEGTGAGAATGYTPNASIGQSYTLTLTKEAGYLYTVTATMNGKETSVTDHQDGTYTIANVTGDIIFTVNKTVIVDNVTVSEYVALDGTVMWLVKNDAKLDQGSVCTYGNAPMYWSEKYHTYCYLVITPVLNEEEAKTQIGIAKGEAVNIGITSDVNITGKVDASDAQLTYNMYNAMYKEFSEDATMEKFLRADINKDGKINVEDAAAIVTEILSK